MKTVAAMVAGLMLIAVNVSADTAQWREFKWKQFGIALQAPSQTAFVMRERDDGWGELHGSAGQAYFRIICKLDVQATEPQIQAYAEKEFGVSSKQWEIFDAGAETNGWNWYKSFFATQTGEAFVAGYGTGTKGSYLVYLKTTETALDQNREAYKKWYHSIRLIDN